MILQKLSVYNLRIINQLDLLFSPGINMIYGANGAGKSSIIEAISILSTGQSYRTRQSRQIIQYHQDNCIFRGVLSNQTSLAVKKDLKGTVAVKVNNEKINSALELARYLPFQHSYEAIFQIIDCGSAVRRQFLDWGIFHCNPEYQNVYKQYKKALSQRNKLLKQQVRDFSLYKPWCLLLAKTGYQLNLMRQRHIEKLLPVFTNVLERISPDLTIKISFNSGWGKDVEVDSADKLEALLTDAISNDLELGYTRNGSHRADLKFSSFENKLAKENLSRGQQKQVLLALKFSLGELMSTDCLYLLDDLASELDTSAIQRVCQYIDKKNLQAIITSLHEHPVFTKLSQNSIHIDSGAIKSNVPRETAKA